jgi:hypothetical protein
MHPQLVIDRLSTEILDIIMSFVHSEDEHSVARVCRRWHEVLAARQQRKIWEAGTARPPVTRLGVSASLTRARWVTWIGVYCNSRARFRFATAELGLPMSHGTVVWGCIAAAMRGCPDVMVYLSENSYFRKNQHWIVRAPMEQAALHRNLNFIEMLAEQAWMYDYGVLSRRAGELDYVDLIDWLWRKDALMFSSAAMGAAQKGHVNILKHIVELWPLTEKNRDAYIAAKKMETSDIRDYALKLRHTFYGGSVAWFAAEGGQTAILRDLVDANVCTLDVVDLCNAVRSGNLETVEYVADRVGVEGNDTEPCEDAIRIGRLDIYTRLRERGWDMTDGRFCRIAAGKGHIHLLQHARDAGEVFEVDFALTAIHFEQRDALAYLLDNGCPLRRADVANIRFDTPKNRPIKRYLDAWFRKKDAQAAV